MKFLTEFFTENNWFTLPVKSASGLMGSYVAAISPNMQDAQWWVSFVIGTMVGVASFVSICIGIYRQLRK